MSFMQIGQWQVHDHTGRRKYVSGDERRRFLAAADALRPELRALSHTLTYTGCRISEALACGPHRLDLEEGAVVFQTLKRRRLCFRRVPIPEPVIAMLLDLRVTAGLYWPMHRATAWRHIKHGMAVAGIEGPMATAKGLRHAFGIHAAAHGVPPSLIQRWMGHASLSTTTIYLDAVGEEEREFAQRMW
jgi:integrase/recombinase XerD